MATKHEHQIGVINSRGQVVAIIETGMSINEAEDRLETYLVSILAPGVTLSRESHFEPSRVHSRRRSRL